MNENAGCKARRMNDQMHCAQCGYQWDIDDTDPPKCKIVDAKPVDPITSIREILKDVK